LEKAREDMSIKGKAENQLKSMKNSVIYITIPIFFIHYGNLFITPLDLNKNRFLCPSKENYRKEKRNGQVCTGLMQILRIICQFD